MQIKEALKKLDFSDKEIEVYLANLDLGESTIFPIARRADIARTTTQYILECLEKRGLVRIIPKKRHVYLPVHPRTILTMLKQKQEKMAEEVDLFKNALPELERIYNVSPFRPQVRIFQGEHIRQIYEEILDSPIEETLFIGEMNKVAEAVGHAYLQKWMKSRAEMQIKTRAIRVGAGEIEDKIFNEKSGYLRSVRLAPEGFESPSHIIIYGDNVAIITTTKENFGVVITSRDYAKTMANCFREAWKNSKHLI